MGVKIGLIGSGAMARGLALGWRRPLLCADVDHARAQALAQEIANQFKDQIPVILNLQGIDADLSKRLIDFSSGLTYALDGGMQRIADKVFMLTPRNVEISAEERARLIEKGFFNQS